MPRACAHDCLILAPFLFHQKKSIRAVKRGLTSNAANINYLDDFDVEEIALPTNMTEMYQDGDESVPILPEGAPFFFLSEDFDITLPTPEGVPTAKEIFQEEYGVVGEIVDRKLTNDITTWICTIDSKKIPFSARIWWGHTIGDAAWACNEWHKDECKGRCSATKITNSFWDCYRNSDQYLIGRVNIWWGHGMGDGQWACNEWVSGCKNSGGCTVHDLNLYQYMGPIYSCMGNGGSCGCGRGSDGKLITLNRFWGDDTDEKVYGCGGAFKLDGMTWSSQWGATLTEAGPEANVAHSVGLSFSQEASYDGWEACCMICGVNLQMAGRIMDGWYCDKDLFSTGIWLVGRDK